MLNIHRIIFFALSLFFMHTAVRATHIVGGEMYYDYLGNNNYRVTLKVYRDCINGQAPFDGQPQSGTIAYMHVFDSNGNLLQQIDLGIPLITPVPPSINNPCIQTPNNVCVEEGKYTYVINLPPLAGGYRLVYQRCCRNNTILNLNNPGAMGSTYQAFVPGPEKAVNNNSPRFNNFPPIFICNGLPIKFNHAATDPDGDQLVYSLCPAVDGLDACCPIISQNMGPSNSPLCTSPPSICPSVAVAPPYPIVNYSSPYNGSYPVASNPSLSINASTGFLTGVPNLNGQWVVNVCVQEFRNNQLIATHYRDFQFNVVTCSVTVRSIIADQQSRCQGDTISFVNNSQGATSYLWDFGIYEIFNDTSNVFQPTYIFPDTGMYEVTLIANPYKPCADTIKKQFYIYPRLNIDFAPQNIQCLKNNSFNFNIRGTYINAATFNWSFGSSATPSVSTDKNPSNIVFTDPGKYFIKLVGKQYTCIDSFIDSVRILDRPKASINNFPTRLCDPAHVSFSNGSVSEYTAQYLWQTSDGFTYNSYEPKHTFSPVGVYGVTLTLIRGGVCPDTSKAQINTFTVSPSPVADFIFSPTITSIFDPEIYFETRASKDVIKWYYDFGDGNSSTFMNEKNTYTQPGKYLVTQVVTNEFECSNEIKKWVTILPEYRFWIPNAFSPDNNSVNDVFKPVLIGISDYSFEIYNRWGEKIFNTNDYKQGWDGTHSGKRCQQDVYVWRIQFVNEVSGKTEYHYGHVMLLNGEE